MTKRRKIRTNNLNCKEPDHDLHIHTFLSACSTDKNQIPLKVVDKAQKLGLKIIGFTDHIWTNAKIKPAPFYETHGEKTIHILREQIAEIDTEIDILVGCEADTISPGKYTITEAFARKVDYVLLACSHFHIKNMVERTGKDSPGDVGKDLILFFNAAVQSGLADIIPHPFFPMGYLELYDKIIESISDEEFYNSFGLASQNNVAIEITPSFIPESMGGKPGRPEWSIEAPLRYLEIAEKAGCSFSLGSDSHKNGDLKSIRLLKFFLEHLSVTTENLWIKKKCSCL